MLGLMFFYVDLHIVLYIIHIDISRAIEFYLDLFLCMLFQCNDGRSPLHMTAVHGRFTRAQTLLEHGERVLISACSGVSALKSVKFVTV